MYVVGRWCCLFVDTSVGPSKRACGGVSDFRTSVFKFGSRRHRLRFSHRMFFEEVHMQGANDAKPMSVTRCPSRGNMAGGCLAGICRLRGVNRGRLVCLRAENSSASSVFWLSLGRVRDARTGSMVPCVVLYLLACGLSVLTALCLMIVELIVANSLYRDSSRAAPMLMQGRRNACHTSYPLVHVVLAT